MALRNAVERYAQGVRDADLRKGGVGHRIGPNEADFVLHLNPRLSRDANDIEITIQEKRSKIVVRHEWTDIRKPALYSVVCVLELVRDDYQYLDQIIASFMDGVKDYDPNTEQCENPWQGRETYGALFKMARNGIQYRTEPPRGV